MISIGITYLIKTFRNRIFVSNNYLVNIMSIHSKYKDTRFETKKSEPIKSDAQVMAESFKNIKKQEEEQKLKLEKENTVQTKVGILLFFSSFLNSHNSLKTLIVIPLSFKTNLIKSCLACR